MSPPVALEARARAAVNNRRGRATDSVKVQQLEALRSRLEALILDVRYREPHTIRGFERMVEEAESIGGGIRAVFRGGGAIPGFEPESPPLQFQSDNDRSRGWW
jgi:hypothetical protein